MKKIKCDACGKWMERTEILDEGQYQSKLQCPACGFSLEVEVDVNEVMEAHRRIESSPKGKLVVYLSNLRELRQLKEYIPELVDVPNSELAKKVKKEGMKWISEEDHVFFLETVAASAGLYGLKAVVMRA